MYVIGGGTPNPERGPVDVHSYHFDTNTWARLDCKAALEDGPVPVGRRSHTCVLFDHKIYVFGGTDGVHMFNDFWYLDLDTLAWHAIPLHAESAAAKCFHAAAMSPQVCGL